MGSRREIEQRIQGLEWQEFERLVYDLIHAQNPDAVRLKPPDSGADVLVPPAGGGPPVAFQTKHYTGKVNWDECEQSLMAARAFKPSRVTFVFSRDLTAREFDTFQRKLAEPHDDLNVDLWTLSNLRALLETHTRVRDNHLGAISVHPWHDQLGVAFAPSPFQLVQRHRGLAGIDAESEKLHPSPSEFLRKLVYPSATVDLIAEQLDELGFAEVRARGATGKTVLAEHIAYRHITDGVPSPLSKSTNSTETNTVLKTSPAYYLKLGSFEKNSRQDIEDVFTRLDTEDALFLIDDVHLNRQAAINLRNAWTQRASGSRMLQLGKVQEVDSRSPVAPEDAYDPFDLPVRADDLIGVYRRLARIKFEMDDPPLPSDEVTDEWLDLFQGDLVVFGAAVMARLHHMLLDDEWQLSEADAAASVRERYLTGLDQQERCDLLCLAKLADAELGAPIAAVRSGLEASVLRGAVLQVLSTWGQDGEFRLAHAGLGRLLLEAAGETDQADELVTWSGSDASLGLSFGAHLWATGESDLAGRLWNAAITSGKGFGPPLFTLPRTTIDTVLEGFEVLEIADRPTLDGWLRDDAAAIAAGMVDDPTSVARTLATIYDEYPTARDALFDILTAGGALRLLQGLGDIDPRVASRRLGSWFVTDPGFATLLGTYLDDLSTFEALIDTSGDVTVLFGSGPFEQLFHSMTDFRGSLAAVLVANPGLEEKIVCGVLSGDHAHLSKAVRFLSRESRSLDEELRRQLTDPQGAGPWDDVESLAPIQLLGLLKFAQSIDASLLERLEESISSSGRQRLVDLLVGQPQAFRDFEANAAIRLVSELVAAARERGIKPELLPATRQGRRRPKSVLVARLEEDPLHVLKMDLKRVLRFITGRHRTWSAMEAASAASNVLTAAEHRDDVVRTALQLPPDSFFRFMAWGSSVDPTLCEGVLSKLSQEPNLSAFSDAWMDTATLADIAGVLELLDGSEGGVGQLLEEAITAPERVGRLVDRAFHGTPGAWAGVLRHEIVAKGLLDAIDERRWRRYWAARKPEGPHWLTSLEVSLHNAGHHELQPAPAEYILNTTSKVEWQSGTLNLAQLSSTLFHGGDAYESAILEFLKRIDHSAMLGGQYKNASAWSIARFLYMTRSRLTPPVFQALLTDDLDARVRLEMSIPWDVRSTTETAGWLALVGALRLADLPADAKPLSRSQALVALESTEPKGQGLTLAQVLVWTGLRTVIFGSGEPLQLGPTPIVGEHLELFRSAEPPDQASAANNASMIEWLSAAKAQGGLLAPTDLLVVPDDD